MALPKPLLPPYDLREWRKESPSRRLQMVCQAWATQGYGTPAAIYLVYLLKLVAYAAGWCFFCSFTPGLGGAASLASWWSAPEAFQKAILWSMAFEGLGLGCGSGPLTGRYYPPFGGALHFCRPGTTKVPLWPGLPILGGDRRTVLDVALYLAHYAFLGRALMAPAVTPELVAPTLVLLPLLGLADKTVFLAARADHFGVALACLLFPRDWIAGEKVLWAAVWLWAATSKLNRHFPSVVAVMQSNSPLTAPFPALRHRFFRSFPTISAPPGSRTRSLTAAPWSSSSSRSRSSSGTAGPSRGRRSR